MPKTTVIQARIDPEIRDKAQKVLEELHLSFSEAIELYLTQVALQRRIPFEVRILNDVTASALQEAEEKKNLHSASSVEHLLEEMAK